MTAWWMQNWVGFAAGYLFFIKLLTAVRDVLDSTPDSDDSVFEKVCTFMSKLGATLLAGKRPQ